MGRSEKCLVLLNSTKQRESMNTKTYICILAGAALLVSCAEEQNSKTGTTETKARLQVSSKHVSSASNAGPSPSPCPEPGKRTEIGTVTGLTASQVRLQVPSISAGHPGAGTQGTFLIDRTDCTHVPPGTAVGSTNVTIEAQEGNWHLVPSA